MPQHEHVEYHAVTHPGLKRSNNEDGILSLSDNGLWLIADGMGGHEAGEIASAIVCDTIKKLAQQSRFSLIDAIQTAHTAIINSGKNGVGAPGMGSTVIALQNRKKGYCIAWVGDSRAYLWTRAVNGGSLARLTTDHSYVQMLFASGALRADELDNHPDKNVITQCLGMRDVAHVCVDTIERQWQPNQWIVLCSDGLTDELTDDQLAEILAMSPTSQQAMQRLLDAALRSGGRDNISLQIIEAPASANAPPASSHWIKNKIFFIGIAVAVVAILLVVMFG